LQNRRLNQHIAYTIMDEVRSSYSRAAGRVAHKPLQVVAAIFPEP